MAALGQQTVGSIVKLNVGGVATDFIVVHQGLPGTMYDASCDGTWLLMKDVYANQTWGTAINGYGNSSAHSYLNTLANSFDISDLIKQVKIPYRIGSSNDLTVKSGSEGLSTKLFLLSYYEAVGSSTNYPVEGAALDYFNGATDSKKIANLNGTATKWWLRTPHYSTNSYVVYVNNNGAFYATVAGSSYGIRPALILPYELNVSDSGLVDGTIASTGAITGSVNINGVLRELTGKGYVNINGVLRDLSDSYANINGVLVSLNGKNPLLPSGYTQLKYVQTNGTQWIDTGYKPNQSTRTVIDVDVTSADSTGSGVFGSRIASQNTAYAVFVMPGTLHSDYYNGYKQTAFSGVGRYIIDSNAETVSAKGTVITHAAGTFSVPYNMLVGSVSHAGTPYGLPNSFVGKIYSCQIYDNGTLVRDFVPCTNSSGVAGLYDVINNKFYASVGTGAFIAGVTA